ncbi:hypothetical protein BCR34DRAFT_194029 [Clohesyomyces aquaticus]|uniref:Uncharacterized protein n=1 Tax=Clohesyomyces aquaticus TaxID=1231657 RepID=A0A1Y1YD94_9PLEO|nr:hypothetical protein BCR34DRAFT_194029 [Clohesyomyces aquaticus]
MNYHPRPHTAFWIPVWLYVPQFLDANGQPRQTLQYLRKIYVSYNGIGYILSIVLPVVLHSQWRRIDHHLCPNTIPCIDPCVVAADTDIAGIGVRTAAYIQSICGTILIGFSSKDTTAVRAVIVTTSLTLALAGGIYGILGKLSLHHGVIVQALLAVVMVPIHIVEPWRIKSPVLYAAQQLRFGAFMALSLWLLIKTPCLGADPQCNMCTSVFFSGRASQHWRRSLGMSLNLSLCIIWSSSQWWTYGLSNLLQTIPALFSGRVSDAWLHHVHATEHTLGHWRRTQNGLVQTILLWYNDDMAVATLLKRRRWIEAPDLHPVSSTWIQRIWTDTKIALRVPRVHRAFVGLVMAVLWAIATERAVAANVSKDANNWGYGQISSIILSVPAFASLVRMLSHLGEKESKVVKRVHTFPA